VNPTAVGVQDAEAVWADFSDFVTFWQVPERTHHQTANGVEFIVGELAVEKLVEVLDRRQGLDQEITAG
jgi:Mn-dependent DtxR family transcriptional regulator